MTQHPEVLWAQRSSAIDDEKNIIYLTINLPDIQQATVEYDLTPTSLSFKAKTGDPSKGIPEKEYAFNLKFYEEVAPESSTYKVTTRSFSALLRKKENKSEYWPRLTKEKVRNAFIKTDFSKWVDEDEQEGAPVPEEEVDETGGLPGGMGGGMPPGMDFQKMMASMGGAGGGMPDFGAGGMPDFGAGGMPDFGAGPSDGGDEEESDDDGPPPLEEAEPAK